MPQFMQWDELTSTIEFTADSTTQSDEADYTITITCTQIDLNNYE